MLDYSFDTSCFFRTKNIVALIKIVNYFRGYKIEQIHNALDDAKFLKEVYEYTQNYEPFEEFPFTEYGIVDDEICLSEGLGKLVATSGKKSYTFDSFLKAAKHFMEYCRSDVTEEHYIEILQSTVGRIKTAIKNHTRFMGMFWKLECNS